MLKHLVASVPLCCCVALLAAPAAPARVVSITTLALEGEPMPGGLAGTCSDIGDFDVNDDGSWMLTVESGLSGGTWFMLRDGAVFLTEGDPIAPAPATVRDPRSMVDINDHGDVGWIGRLDGVPEDREYAIYFNTALVLQSGDVTTAPELTPGTTYTRFRHLVLNDSNEMVVLAEVDDPATAGDDDEALVRLRLDAAGALISESVVAKTGEVLPAWPEPAIEFSPRPNGLALNAAGQVMFTAATPDYVWRDHVAVYLDDAVLAWTRDGPAPLPGFVVYRLPNVPPVALNDAGDSAFQASLTAPGEDDVEVIIVNGGVYVREGDVLEATAPWPLLAGGWHHDPGLDLDDCGRVAWTARWRDDDVDAGVTGLFVGDELIVHTDGMRIDGMPVRSVGGSLHDLRMSDNGRWVLCRAQLEDWYGRRHGGAFLVELAPEPCQGCRVLAPDDLTVECPAPASGPESLDAWLASAVPSIECAGGVSWELVAETLGCGGMRELTYELWATDASGVESPRVRRTWREVDTTPPELLPPGDLTVECPAPASGPGSEADWLAAAGATDACSEATLSRELVSSTAGCAGTVANVWELWATDECGNEAARVRRTWQSVDTTPPELLPPGDLAVECPAPASGPGSEADWLASAGATDACSEATLSRELVSSTAGCAGTVANVWEFWATDECGNEAARVRRTWQSVDTTPPDFGGLALQFDLGVWPPDHRYRVFAVPDLASAADACGAARVDVTGCSSSQPEDVLGRFLTDDASGDGSTLADCAWSADGLSFAVRAERLGACGPDSSRAYAIHLVATDECGNEALGEGRIRVAHDRRTRGRPAPAWVLGPLDPLPWPAVDATEYGTGCGP